MPIVLALCALLSPAARAAVLVSSPPVSGGGVARWSQLWQDPSPAGNDLDGDSICWADFTFAAPASIDHMEWWGKGASELGFRIEFWRQDPGTIAYQPLAVFDQGPGPSTVTPEARFTVAPLDYSTAAEAGGITHFSLDLANPVDLGANDAANPRWFVGIIGLTHQAYVTWDWSQGAGGGHTFQFVRGGFDGGGYAFRSLGDGRAFLLAGVPEPAGMAILIAAAGFGSLRRPRRDRLS
jgi:hypothetical protein